MWRPNQTKESTTAQQMKQNAHFVLFVCAFFLLFVLCFERGRRRNRHHYTVRPSPSPSPVGTSAILSPPSSSPASPAAAAAAAAAHRALRRSPLLVSDTYYEYKSIHQFIGVHQSFIIIQDSRPVISSSPPLPPSPHTHPHLPLGKTSFP